LIGSNLMQSQQPRGIQRLNQVKKAFGSALITIAGWGASKQMPSDADVAQIEESRMQLCSGSPGVPAFSAVQRQRRNFYGVGELPILSQLRFALI
jgi:hypothetical protein